VRSILTFVFPMTEKWLSGLHMRLRKYIGNCSYAAELAISWEPSMIEADHRQNGRSAMRAQCDGHGRGIRHSPRAYVPTPLEFCVKA